MPQPLIVAGVAAALLVVVVGVDVAIDRSFVLELKTAPDEWTQIASTQMHERYVSVPRPYAEAQMPVNRTDTLEFRLRVENDYPWALDERFEVYSHGQKLAEGRLQAPAGGAGQATFEVTVARLMDGQGYMPSPERGAPQLYSLYVEVYVDGQYVSGSFAVREVSR